MARKEEQERRQGSGLKNPPTLVETYLLSLVGAGLWTPEKAERMKPIIMNALKANPALAQRMQVVAYSMDPEVQSQITSIHESMNKVQQRKEKREERTQLWYDKTFKGKTPEELSKKDIEKWSTEQDRVDALNKSDDRTLAQLAKAEKDIKYPEEIKEREAIRQTEKNQAFTEKWIDKISAAEDKKEEEKEKRKIAKGKLIGGQIAEMVGGVGEGFMAGRRIRGY